MADSEDDYPSRAIAHDCVRKFATMNGHTLACQVEDDLICAVEDMLDEEVRDELAEEKRRADGLDEKLDKTLDNAKALAGWLEQVLDLVKRDPLGSTAECPCCGGPLEDGEHYDCDLANLLSKWRTGF